MKIEEARQQYSTQIKAYQEQKLLLAKQKQELEQKMRTTPDGENVFAKEAATLELTYQAVSKQQEEYHNYMKKLTEQWVAAANMVSSKQQGEAMKEYVEDLGKIMEVARRLMKGGIVPASDEKKLMEYSYELYQAAKNIGALAKEKEKYKSLWEEEEEKEEPEDPLEVADNTEAPSGEPQIVEVEELMAASASEAGTAMG